MKKNEIFTVENAKVNCHVYEVYQNKSGYIKEGDGLVAVSVKSVTVDLKKVEVVTVLADNSGKEYVRTGDFSIYASPKDFENNIPVEASRYHASHIIRHADIRHLMNCESVNVDIDDEGNAKTFYVQVWCFEDGEPVARPIVVNSVVCDKDGWHLVDGTLPEKFWESKKDAFSFNEYKVVDDDGDEFIEKGIMKRLMLTPEQWTILNELKACFRKALDANIGFVWDRDNCGDVEAYNKADADGLCWESSPEENETIVDLQDIAFANAGICFDDYCGCDRDIYFRMKQTERQKKEWAKAHPEEK